MTDICEDEIETEGETSPEKCNKALSSREEPSSLNKNVDIAPDSNLSRQLSSEGEIPAASGASAISEKLSSVLSNIRHIRNHNLLRTVEQQSSVSNKRKRASVKEKSASVVSDDIRYPASGSPQGKRKKSKHTTGSREVAEEAPSVSPETPTSKGRGKKAKINNSKADVPDESNVETSANISNHTAKESPSLKSKVESLKQLFTFSKEKNKMKKGETFQMNQNQPEVGSTEKDDPLLEGNLKDIEKSLSNEESPTATSTQNMTNKVVKIPESSASPSPVKHVQMNPQAPKVSISTLAFLKLQKFRSKTDSTSSSDDNSDGKPLQSSKTNPTGNPSPSVDVQRDVEVNSVLASQTKPYAYDAFKAIKCLGKKLHSSQKMKISNKSDNPDSLQRSQPSQGSGFSSQVFSVAGDDFDDFDLEL